HEGTLSVHGWFCRLARSASDGLLWPVAGAPRWCSYGLRTTDLAHISQMNLGFRHDVCAKTQLWRKNTHSTREQGLERDETAPSGTKCHFESKPQNPRKPSASDHFLPRQLRNPMGDSQNDFLRVDFDRQIGRLRPTCASG